jgi:hypothetical protein
VTPFALTSAYIASTIDAPLDVTRVDGQFASDPVLGARLSFSSYKLVGAFPELGPSALLFESPNSIVTLADGNETFLTASALLLAYDPTLNVPFFAPLENITLNTSLGSAFINEFQSRLQDPNQLPFDLAFQASGMPVNFDSSFDVPANVGIVQNFELSSVPEPSTLILFCIGSFGLLGCAWRCRRQAA